MNTYCLKTNRMISPMGIDAGEPILSWLCVGGMRQTAFRVKMECDGVIFHDSEEITSAEMHYCPSVSVKARKRVRWSVSVKDENGVWGDESYAEFETGIARDEFVAKWINPELTAPEYCRLATDDKPLNKASYLKKEFFVDSLGKARLYVTAHGVYNVYLNGAEVEGYFMAPGSSDYEKRLQVQTYDVTSMLKEGKNEILVTIGEGWWRGSVGWDMARYCFGTDIALLCQLEIDGFPILISDESWLASQNGPLEENDTMRLERYNALKEITDWHKVTLPSIGFDNLIGTELPITTHERFKARLLTSPNGQKILDFGQNFAGYVELDLTARGGEKIKLTHGEALTFDGNFQNDNFQNPASPICRQVIEYTCKPGRNRYHQTKSYYGFRYVLLETELDVTGEEFTGVAIYSDMAQTGFFECGVQDVNKLFNNIIWSMKSNFVDVPTDCPHREKLGFTGDCQVFSGAALYLMDSYPVLRRWLRESVSCQTDDGCILYIAPPFQGPQKGPRGMDGSAGWSSSMTIVPQRFLHYLNSPNEIREYYDAIKKWIAYNLNRAKRSRPENETLPDDIRDYILDTAANWGEWCEPGKTSADYSAEARENGHAEEATAFLAYDCYLASDMARSLGEREDADYYHEIYEKVKRAYLYVFTNGGVIESERQCHYVRPIAHKLLEEDKIKDAVDSLAKLIKQGGNKIGTGFLTTCHICDVLTENGLSSVAYDLLLQREQPSWLFEVEQGATTVWESWFGIRKGANPRGSLNHYSLGAIAGWLIKYVLGITVYDGSITVRPYPDARLGYASGSYLSPVGLIASSWKYTDTELVITVEIPSNNSATLILPDGSRKVLSPGVHEYSLPK
ncbi:MAG: family 78 glycoside hydrolase catalytic domain [Clostridia bacterium]|nr:family 78 glycoside hydrolase catalytic domain [Clostridia bacterium]